MPPESNPLPKRASGRLARLLGAALVLALATTGALVAQDPPEPPGPAEEGPVPETPAAVLDVVEIHPFSLDAGYRHEWLASRPEVRSGLLVVLKIDPRYVLPRDAAEPVLYGAGTTVQPLNRGFRSGMVIGIVPGEPDLASSPFFFGRPELPARVTAETLAEQRALAERAGIKPFSEEQIARAMREGVAAEDLAALLREAAADLVLRYSPDERSLAETWRLPATGATLSR